MYAASVIIFAIGVILGFALHWLAVRNTATVTTTATVTPPTTSDSGTEARLVLWLEQVPSKAEVAIRREAEVLAKELKLAKELRAKLHG